MPLSTERRLEILDQQIRDPSNPSKYRRTKSFASKKLRKWRKPRNLVNVLFEVGTSFLPQFVGTPINWAKGKAMDAASNAHHDAKMEAALDEGDEGGEKAAKHVIKAKFKEAFDDYARKARKTGEKLQQKLGVCDDEEAGCVEAAQFLLSFRKYERRIGKMRASLEEMKNMLQIVEEWVENAEEPIRKFRGAGKAAGAAIQTNPFLSTAPPSDALRTLMDELTQHDEICDRECCVNLKDPGFLSGATRAPVALASDDPPLVGLDP